MDSLPVFAGVCLVFGTVALVATIGNAISPGESLVRRVALVALLLALACFLLSMGFGSIALMNGWGATSYALEGVAVISGSAALLLPLIIWIGYGARAVVRRVTRPTRG